MKLKRLFFACAESTGAEFDKNRAAKIDYLETHTQEFIELIEAAMLVKRHLIVDSLEHSKLDEALQPFEGDK